MSRAAPLPAAGNHQPLRVTIRPTATALVLAVSGEFDNIAVARLEAAAGSAVAQLRGRPLVVDLSELDFLGSAGVSALAQLHHRIRDQLRVVGLNTPLVRRPIEISGLHHALRFHDTVERASPTDSPAQP